jgi:tripartite-type tricarboxylate transporter receptor subunit TctC
MSWVLKVAAFAAAASLSFAAHSQQVIRIVTGGTPGDSMDLLSRGIAEPLGQLLNRTVIVENKPGGSFTIAASYAAKAAPDGNTILITFNVHPLSSLAFPNLNYDPVADFRAVGRIATVPYVVFSHPSLPGSNLKEMLELAKKQGRSPSFATIGPATPHNLMMEGVKGQMKADFRTVHYKSGSPAQTDVIAGHVDFSLLSRTSMIESAVKAGKLKVLAVTSAARLPEYPDAPTVAELGLQGFVADGWYAMLVPAKTPASIVTTYNEALNKVLAMPAMQERLRTLGAIATPGAPDVLDHQMRADAAMWRKIIADNNLKLE